MKRLFLALAICVLFIPTVGAVQTPPLQATFTCNLSGAKCAEFLRLVANGLGCPAGTNPERTACVATKTANHLTRIAIDQKKGEDSNAAINAAEATFRADFPDQP